MGFVENYDLIRPEFLERQFPMKLKSRMKLYKVGFLLRIDIRRWALIQPPFEHDGSITEIHPLLYSVTGQMSRVSFDLMK